jgi:hypothetical protein
MIMAVVRMVPSKACSSIRMLSCRCHAATPSAAMTPRAADSVAVARPA